MQIFFSGIKIEEALINISRLGPMDLIEAFEGNNFKRVTRQIAEAGTGYLAVERREFIESFVDEFLRGNEI